MKQTILQKDFRIYHPLVAFPGSSFQSRLASDLSTSQETRANPYFPCPQLSRPYPISASTENICIKISQTWLLNCKYQPIAPAALFALRHFPKPAWSFLFAENSMDSVNEMAEGIIIRLGSYVASVNWIRSKVF
ncbi:hypothetical protein AVEN_272513-1 [Araneus ventricosus]|uniref:Uncharacterized protein n=1 Tax=Araneus ventricosus TaxID=182803 RepID=A0A4Y2SKX0_ARAVE|nr:hypothetical protein AVEN_272513-1 [Araneus ventricosus]